jgi:hypothetical protein
MLLPRPLLRPLPRPQPFPTTVQVPLVAYGLTMLREAVVYIALAILWLFGYARVRPSLPVERNLSRLRPCPFPFLSPSQCLPLHC